MKMTNSKGQIPKKSTIFDIVDDFACASSLHGVKYTRRKNSSFTDRLVWTAAVLVCVACTAQVGYFIWRRYRTVPTSIDVLDTNQPLHSLTFPSVTVCSGTRLKKRLASHLLSKYLPPASPPDLQDHILLNIMSVLSLLQFPNYHLMSPYLSANGIKESLEFFVDLNVTDFMLKVMPKCEEVFDSCFWHGTQINCCEEFLLQRTEQGFCWSFNSFTSENTSNCPVSELLENEGLVAEDQIERSECSLRRNTGYGTGSGLEIRLRPSDPRDQLPSSAQRLHDAVSVLVHTSYMLPLAGTSVQAPTVAGSRTRLAVVPEVTVTTPQIRQLSQEERKCVFPDEQRLRLHHVYTKSACLSECRNKYIMLVCRCKLYFFSFKDYRVPECGLIHMDCVARNSEKLRFYRPPDNTPGMSARDLKDSLNCECPSLCFDSVYDIDVSRRDGYGDVATVNSTRHAETALLDIYYKITGFFIYKRHIVFGFMDLIVALGGAANLFLGFSLLSIVECVYWVTKILSALISTKKVRRKVTKVYPTSYIE